MPFVLYFAIQLSICRFSASAEASSVEKASCLNRQLTYISTDAFIRQAFFATFLTFFTVFLKSLFAAPRIPILYTIYSITPFAYRYFKKSAQICAKKKAAPCERPKDFSFAARASGAVPGAFFGGFSRCGVHFARPLAPCGRAAGRAADGVVELPDEFIEFFAARGANVLKNRHILSLAFASAVPVVVMMAAAAPDLAGRLDADGVGGTDDKEGHNAGHDDADADEQPESPRETGKGNGDVHAPQAGDEGRHRDDERDDGEQFHDDVQVVGDDGGVGVHGPRENVAVDVTHLHCLTRFDDDVVEQIAVVLVSRDGGKALELVIDVEIGTQRRRKVDERIFDAQELNEFLIFHGAVQFGLQTQRLLVELAQVGQKPLGVAHHEAQDEVDGALPCPRWYGC